MRPAERRDEKDGGLFVWEDGVPAPRGRGDGGTGRGAADEASAEARSRTRAEPDRRRRVSAGAALGALLLGFVLGGLLDAAALRRDAEALPLGARRTVLVWLVAPGAALSGGLGLDGAARAVDRVLGRADTVPHKTVGDLAPAASKPAWPRTVSAQRPLRLYVAGDSMAGQFGGPFIGVAEKTGVIDGRLDYHVSSGLSRPDYFDWQQRLIDMIYKTKADATVFLVGGNDAQKVKDGDQVLDVGSEAWLALYHDRVSSAMAIGTEGGRRMYWVGQPIMRDGFYGERMKLLDEVYASEAARHPGVTYIDTWELFSTPQGKYADYLRSGNGDLVRMRQGDGVHLMRAGADRMAERVLEVVKTDWKID